MASSRNRTPPELPVIAAVAAVLAAAGVGAGSRLCVALSGGVDSVVLLHALAALRGRFGHRLAAAHVHHGLSPHADDWRAFCKRLCLSLGVDFHAFEVHVDARDPAGLEAAARRARHRALADVPADWLLFGHQQEDQAETLLFRLLRGTGLRGAGAMASVEAGVPGRLRPLLALRRAEILTYARGQRLAWIEDESNLDRRFKRNHLRHAVFPVLEQAFASAVPTLARAAEHFREGSELLDDLAAIDQRACGGSPLDVPALLGLSDARIRNLLRWQIRAMGGEAPPRARLVEAVRQLRGASQHPLYLPLGALACCVYRGQLWFEAISEGEVVGGDTVPSALASGDAGVGPAAGGGAATAGVGATMLPWHGAAALPWASGRIDFERVVGHGLDAARLEQADEVVVVPRWAGLTMRQGAARPRRSFKNLCQEAGVPAWLRARLPVLRVDGEAAWIAEIGVAAAFACPPRAPGIMPVWQRHR